MKRKVGDFVCPGCGHKEVFKTLTETGIDGILHDPACPKCGRSVTEDDIWQQALKILDKLVRDAARET